MSAVIHAGFPSPANEYMDVKLDLNSYLVKHPAATFFVRVVGNSMTGAGVHSGDILVVDRSLTPENTRVVIAEVDGELIVRRVLEENGKLHLVADGGDRAGAVSHASFSSVAHPLGCEKATDEPTASGGAPPSRKDCGTTSIEQPLREMPFEIWGVVTNVIHPL